MGGRCPLTVLISVVVLLLIMFCYCLADFAEVPSSVTNVSENQNALFRCRHEQPDAIINWLINGTPSSRYPDITVGSISECNGTLVDTLTIPAIPVYNGTEIVCGALFFDGSPSEKTPPVTLILMTGPPPSTDVTSEPTTNPPATFEITPSSLTVAVEQEVAVFVCQHLNSDDITWLVNGTSLNRINSPNITTSSSGTMHALTIGTLLEYSGTTVVCVATFLDGSPPIFTPPVTLLIQGTPGKVKFVSINRNSSSSLLTTRWSSLPSLDLDDTDPDIVYSVELYKITCGEDIFMSHEDVFVNSTNNTVDPMEIYKVIITARNNVEGARNGTSVEIREKFMTLNKASLFQLTQNSQFNSRDNTPVPSYYTMILEPLDGHQEQNLMINISVKRNGEMVNMSVDGEIPTKTLWNASLLAYGCQSDTVVKGVELSTHDIQNISVTSPQPGEVRVTGDFIDGSTATGLLTIIISTSEIFYHLIERGSDQLHIEGSIQGVVGGEHSISFFVVKESGLPFNRTASTPKVVSVEHGNDVNQPSIEYSLQSTSTGVCITCTFLDSSTTDCVAVVHQRISQLSSSGLMNIELSHKLTRSGDTASGCIEGVDMEDYQVGVVGGKRLSPPVMETKDRSSSIEGLAVGVVLGVLIVLAVVVVVSLIVVRKRTKSPDIETRGPPPPTSDYVVSYSHETSRAEHDEASEPLLSSSPSPPLPSRQGGNRVHSDGSSHSSPSSEDAIETDITSHSPPPVPPRTEDSKVLLNESPCSPPVAHDDVKEIKNSEDHHYATLGELGNAKKTFRPDDRDQKPTVYVEIQSHSRGPTTPGVSGKQGMTSDKNMAKPETHTDPPFTVEYIFPALLFMASMWEALGEALSLDEDRLDEIFTNNETDEACLRDMLEHYMKRSDLKHSWEEIREARKKVEEKNGGTDELDSTSQRSQEGMNIITDIDANGDPVVKEAEENQSNYHKNFSETHTHPPSTVECILPASFFMASKSLALGKALSLDEDHLDEIFTNNETDEACLRVMLLYMKRSDLKHSITHETYTHPPSTVECILPASFFMASKRLALGKALSLDENLLGGIFTNNETDEACLHVMLELYLKRSDLKHSWEEILESMRKVEEKDGETEELEPTSQRSPMKKLFDTESEVDKTDYKTALRKQLNIGGASTRREREEPECGDLSDLCQASKKSACLILVNYRRKRKQEIQHFLIYHVCANKTLPFSVYALKKK